MKKLNISEKTNIKQELLKEEGCLYIDIDLFKRYFPISRLNNELARLNDLNKERLHGRVIWELLDVLSIEEINKIRSEAKAREESEIKAREESEIKAREESEAKDSEESEAKDSEEAEAKDSEEAETKDSEESEAKDSEEAETKAREEAEKKSLQQKDKSTKNSPK